MKVGVNIHCHVFAKISYVNIVFFYNYMSAWWVFCYFCVLLKKLLIFLIEITKPR